MAIMERVTPEQLDALAWRVNSHHSAPRERLARALGVNRDTLWRWTRRAPSWVVFAFLGVAVSSGDRERAAQLLEAELTRTQ